MGRSRPLLGVFGGLPVLACAAVFTAACGDDQEPRRAARLLDEIRAQDYPSWQRAPGYEVRRPAASPHSDQVDIFVNDVMAQALAGPALTAWPDGSIVVKDGYSGSKRELIAVMQKEGGEWFWAEYFGGEAKYSGSPEVCTSCHRNGSDFVRAFPLPQGQN
jgi:hypothetical protein